MMNILVTGGAGFIGSHLCEKLLSLGHRVICVDNFNDYYDPNLKHRNIAAIKENSSFTLYTKDIRDKDAMNEIFEKEKPDAVIHLAAMAGVRNSFDNPELYFDVNVMGTLKLLEISVKYGVKRFIFSSSSSVYGDNPNMPLNETYIPQPSSPYALTKYFGEKMCSLFSQNHQIKIICLRFFTVYGPRGRPDMGIPKFLQAINTGKEITLFDNGALSRDFTYVVDIVKGIVSSLTLDRKYEIINLGNGKIITISNLVQLMERLTSKSTSIVNKPKKQGEVMHTSADISKAGSLLGYSPATDIEEGMKNFIMWFENENK